MLHVKWILALIVLSISRIEAVSYVSASIHGQQGNNMFQVAAASALAWDNGAIPTFPELVKSPELLRHVFFRCSTATPKEGITWNEPPENCHVYKPIPYKPNIKIHGYFQSEKHFAHYREEILALFAPHPDDLNYLKTRYEWLFAHPKTVGIQLRYYRAESPTPKIYPQYGKDYLTKACALFPEDSLFVVSSNNLDFARKNLPEGLKNVVILENEKAYLELYLLMFCKDQIITNSSFGWWAAWMNQNPDKIVVRPKVWIHTIPYTEVCPKSWITLDSKYQ